MKVRVSSAARADLLGIIRYISDHNPFAARRIRNAVHSRFEKLALFPDRGRRVGSGNVRRTIESHHLIFYEVLEDEVVITRIVDGRRDIARIIAADPDPSGPA